MAEVGRSEVKGSTFLTGLAFLTAMEKAGLVPANTYRVTIDAEAGGPVTLTHVSYLDDRALAFAEVPATDDPAEARA